MAKSKEWTPRRVRSEDERGIGSSQYMQLDEGEKFLGYALFEGDPSEDEAGYYEYMEHWNNAARKSVPCAGDDCPFCEDGDKPKDRAKSLWLVVKDAKGNEFDPPELRIFNLNSILIKQITEMRGEGDKIMGRLFRVTRTDDRGNYVLMPKDKTLKKTEVKEALKSKDAPDFDSMVTSQLRKAMEGIAVARALDDDDDEDEPTSKKSKDKGKKGKPAKDEPGDWPDELDEEVVTVKKVAKDGNYVEVESDDYEDAKKVWTTDDIEFDLSELSKGDEITVTTGEQDDDGDYILTAEPETGGDGGTKSDDVEDIEDEELELLSVKKSKNSVVVEWDEEEVTLVGGDDIDVSDFKKGDTAKISAEYDSDEEEWTLTSIEEPDEAASDEDEDGNGADGDLPDSIEDEELTVVSIDAAESTMEVKNEDLAFTLYFLDQGPASKVDFDDYEKGAKIKVSAEKDSTGDLVATAVPKVVGSKGGKKTEKAKKPAAKKGGKKATVAKKGGKGKKK